MNMFVQEMESSNKLPKASKNDKKQRAALFFDPELDRAIGPSFSPPHVFFSISSFLAPQ